MKKRILSLLLALVMVLGMFPVSAMAAGGNSVTAYLTAVDCVNGKFVYTRKALTVTPGLAKEYLGGEYGVTYVTPGWVIPVTENDVTAADVLVAAHLDKYGSVGDYIDGTMDYVSKIFGETSDICYTVNGVQPYDPNGPYGATGYAINQYIVHSGDEICFYLFSYYDELNDVWASFRKAEVETTVNECVTLNLDYSTGYVDATTPAGGVDIYVLNADGSIGTTKKGTTDVNGQVTVSFDTAGTYYLTCKGTVSYMGDSDWDGIPDEATGTLSPAYCKVTVTGSAEPEHECDWEEEWNNDETHHWHECAADGCTVTEDSEKNGYAEHSWNNATCKAPKTCSACGKTDGEADSNAHSYKDGKCEYCQIDEPTAEPENGTTINLGAMESLNTGKKVYYAKINGLSDIKVVMPEGDKNLKTVMSGVGVFPACEESGDSNVLAFTADALKAAYVPADKQSEVQEPLSEKFNETSDFVYFYIKGKNAGGSSVKYYFLLEIAPCEHNYVDGTCEHCGEEEPEALLFTATADGKTVEVVDMGATENCYGDAAKKLSVTVPAGAKSVTINSTKTWVVYGDKNDSEDTVIANNKSLATVNIDDGYVYLCFWREDDGTYHIYIYEAECEQHNYIEGVCEYCGAFVCEEDPDAHNFVDGACTVCGKPEIEPTDIIRAGTGWSSIDWPYQGCNINRVTVNNVKVDGFTVNGSNYYITLNSAVADDAAIELAIGTNLQYSNLWVLANGVSLTESPISTSTELPYTVQLENGAATLKLGGSPGYNTGKYIEEYAVNKTFYFSNSGKFPIAPMLSGGNSTAALRVENDTWSADLATLFKNISDKDMTYKVAIDGAEAVECDANYTYICDTPGTRKLVFTAVNDYGTSPSYTVTISVLPEESVQEVNYKVQGGTITWFAFTDDNLNALPEGTTYAWDAAATTWTITQPADINVTGKVITYYNLVKDDPTAKLPLLSGSNQIAGAGTKWDGAVRNQQTNTLTNGAVNAYVYLYENAPTGGNEGNVYTTLRFNYDRQKPDTYFEYKVDGNAELTIAGDHGGVNGHQWVADREVRIALSSDTPVDAIISCVEAGKSVALSSGAGQFSYTTGSWPNEKTWTIKCKIDELPSLKNSEKTSENVTIPAQETYTIDLAALFTDADGDETLTYQVKLNDGDWTNIEGSKYSYIPETAQDYVLTFRAYDGFVYTDETYTVNMTVTNAVETYTVSVTAPENVLFYCTAEFAEGVDVLGTPINTSYAEGVYTLSVPTNASRISWRMGEIGMSTTVEADAELALIEANFKIMAGETEDAGALTVKYGDYKAVGSANSYLLVAGEEYSYAVTPADTLYRAYNENGNIPASGENVIELTLKHITVIAPEGATVSSGRFYSYFRYDFNKSYQTTTLDDGRISVDFPVPGSEAFIRVQHPDGVTYWDFGGLSDGTTVEVTEAMLFIGSEDFNKETVYPNYEKNSHDTADLYMTINAQGWLDMDSGDTHSLNVFRNWIPVANSTSNNGVSLPDVTYTVVSVDGTPSDVVEVVPDTNNSCYADIKAVKAGTAIILVTYDAVYNADGEGGKQFSAIWPENTGVIVVTVDAPDSNIQTNITVNEEANAGGKQILDVEHDILFYVGDTGAEYSFKPEDGCTVTVARSTVGTTMTFGGFTANGVSKAEDGTVTISGLTTGTHIIKLEKNGKIAYQVIRAREVSYKLTHSDGTEVTAENPAQPGETVTVQFSRLIAPQGKLSGVYNANFGFYYNGEDGAEYRIASGYAYGDYYFGSNAVRQRFTVTVPAEWNAQTYTLTDGGIKLGGYGASFGKHRSTSYLEGKEVNTNASGAAGVAAVLPDVIIPVDYEAPAVETYTVTLPTDEGYTAAAISGSVSPVEEGGSFSFTISFAEGYEAGDDFAVKANGNKLTVSNNIYTISNITADQVITVEGVVEIESDNPGGDTPEPVDGKVYISISHEGKYVKDKNGAYVTYVPVELDALKAIDLTDYNLSDFIHDENSDSVQDITALHLYIYVHENILGKNWNTVTVTGDKGSIYFSKGLFGFENFNLQYYHNGAYPLQSDGITGLTADEIVLEGGDFFDIAHYTNLNFHTDSAFGFHYFLNNNEIVHEYSATTGNEQTIALGRGAGGMGNGGSNITKIAGYTVYYGKTFGTADGSFTTNASGKAKLTFNKAGTWYFWVDGSKGIENPNDIVSSPAYAKVTVTGDTVGSGDVLIPAPEPPATYVVTLTSGEGYTITASNGSTSPVPEDGSYRFVVTIADGYKKGENFAVKANGTVLTAVNGVYTIANISADQTVTVEGVVEKDDEPTTYTVTLTSGEGYTITATNGSTSPVTEGGSYSFAVTIVDGYETSENFSVKANGSVLTADEGVYTISNITAAQTVTVNGVVKKQTKPVLTWQEVMAKTQAYLTAQAESKAPIVGSTKGEWMVLGLARNGVAANSQFFTGYYVNAVRYIEENIDEKTGRLDENLATENARVILALTALGKDVTNIEGYNLLQGLSDTDFVQKQGINGPVWALIALDSHNYEIPTNADSSKQVTRDWLVEYILSKQLTNGGWALSGQTPDDMTPMAVQALAPYYSSNTEVKTAVDKALKVMATMSATPETYAQMIVALSALNIDCESDERFADVMDKMLAFALENGSFKKSASASSANQMSTEQAFYALVAYSRYVNNKTSLYDMSDVTIVIPEYKIIDGANSDWQKDDDALTIRADGEFAKFTGVKVDGATVDSKHYTAKAGSTIVTFKADYLKTLSEGVHTISVVFKDGEASTTVTVLPTDEEVAKRVINLIDGIGTVTEASGDKIKVARNAYDALTENQKKLVTNYKKLTDAEAAYDKLVSKISVTFTLLGCYKHDSDKTHTLADGNLNTWIAKKTYKVEPGATVKDVLEMALKEAGMSHRNPTGNYVESINGIGEFTNGSNSGWMYTLNGVHPNLGVAEQTLKNGDVIVFHYTDDYTREKGGTGFGEDTAIQKVEDLINAIGTVTLNSKDKIDAARKAYDALTYTQKQQVENYKKLTDAEAKYAELKKADDEKKADAVETLIDKIDSKITLDSEGAIVAARKAYNALTADQKKLVNNYKKLTDAEYDLALLKADEKDKEAAKNVEKLIDAIGTVTLASEEKIKAAREAYDKLTDTQKALVKNYAELEQAESKLVAQKDLAEIQDAYKTTGDYLENIGTPVPGSVGGEWMVIGLIRSGRQIRNADAYYEAVVKFVQENIDENGRLHNAKSTENSRIILALTAMGKDVTNVGGYNLLTGLNNMEYVQKQGINGPIWALIALDSGNYPVPVGNVTREALIQVILDAQLADGGWALSGSVSDPDMTGMALQALAPYYKKNVEVKKVVDEAIETLSMMQAADGSFASIDGSSSESIAQVVAALSTLGIDANTDSRFIKNGMSALDALYAFYVQGGGFKHIPNGKLDGMATEQSYYALAAYFRMLDGKTTLFNMTDVIDMGGDKVEEEPTETLPAETEPNATEPTANKAENKGGFPWWLVIVIVVLAGAIVVLVIVSKPRKRGRHEK